MTPETKMKKVSTCSFCGRTLGSEYHFTCHICDATYCYIHMWKHSKAHPTISTLQTNLN